MFSGMVGNIKLCFNCSYVFLNWAKVSKIFLSMKGSNRLTGEGIFHRLTSVCFQRKCCLCLLDRSIYLQSYWLIAASLAVGALAAIGPVALFFNNLVLPMSVENSEPSDSPYGVLGAAGVLNRKRAAHWYISIRLLFTMCAAYAGSGGRYYPSWLYLCFSHHYLHVVEVAQ